jgi:hypothetical protein
MFHTARGTGDFSAMGAVIEAQRKMLLSQHELITSAPVQQRDVKINVIYSDDLNLADLVEIAPAVLLRLPCQKIWDCLERHLNVQLPRVMDEARKMLAGLTEEQRNELVHETVAEFGAGTATSQAN